MSRAIDQYRQDAAQAIPADEVTLAKNTVPVTWQRQTSLPEFSTEPSQDLSQQRREMTGVWIVLGLTLIVAAAVAVAGLLILRDEIPAAPAAADVIEIDLDNPPAGGSWADFDLRSLPPVR